MKCDCGNKLNIHNKDGICNECITENKMVKIRFVEAGPIYECWSLEEYLSILEFCKKENKSYKVFEYEARAGRVVNIIRYIRADEKGEDIELEYLLRDLLKVFLIDVIGAIKEEDITSTSKLMESFQLRR